MFTSSLSAMAYLYFLYGGSNQHNSLLTSVPLMNTSDSYNYNNAVVSDYRNAVVENINNVTNFAISSSKLFIGTLGTLLSSVTYFGNNYESIDKKLNIKAVS